ncbi:MAG: hypothetical protein JST01_28000 [Cyanobacteria bacterium SZAS TMP-1]|nr:hypothetical protein [Cyanobacteria bacterium SZAS TMP-1]
MAQAVTWIRDGVLVDRMHVNPVAFAVAFWRYTPPAERVSVGMEQLINFGFAKSGLSCGEKIQLFNAECGVDPAAISMDIAAAVAFYNELSTRMARSCTYFNGAVPLVKSLHERGVLNFIISAVEQQVLDIWAQVGAGQEISPFLTEILGKRPNFLKRRDHFEYIQKKTDDGVNYFVADAPSEIAMAADLSRTLNIMPIGFAHAVDRERVVDALGLARTLCDEHHDDWLVVPPYDLGDLSDLAANLIYLPDPGQLVAALQDAGAAVVVAGDAEAIMSGVASLLDDLTNGVSLPV